MLFSEIIKTDGVEGVASKTNISTVNLGYLVEEDFKRLNRVKALGFLLILEREYKDIDVTELRERIKIYYEENRPHDDKVVMVAKDSVEGDGFSFFKYFIIALLIGGAFYLYSDGKLDSLIQNIEDKKDFFDDKKALENNVSTENADKVVVGKSEAESVSIETPVAPKVETIVLNDETLDSDKNDNENKNEVLTQRQLALNLSKVEEVNRSVESVVKEVSEEFLANERNISLGINDVEEPSSSATLTTINVNPTRGMLWFGFINLDSKKRREFMKKSSTPFNINNSKWLLVTGHGYLDIVADDKTIELADNKKHYFYIDSSEMREIDKKEFRKLNGRRGW
ncbi:MAG: Membrane protein [uncultured Sulfurovum sp.]|uniref:Membrane protein n=1 Tax=uncultured Sulfurovum sp. TaxID=269237 RepID=A0A6S6T9Y7_9BACT|nr:MAG: Membrane protein [uncultured Sulfurovum sp.]